MTKIAKIETYVRTGVIFLNIKFFENQQFLLHFAHFYQIPNNYSTGAPSLVTYHFLTEVDKKVATFIKVCNFLSFCEIRKFRNWQKVSKSDHFSTQFAPKMHIFAKHPLGAKHWFYVRNVSRNVAENPGVFSRFPKMCKMCQKVTENDPEIPRNVHPGFSGPKSIVCPERVLRKNHKNQWNLNRKCPRKHPGNSAEIRDHQNCPKIVQNCPKLLKWSKFGHFRVKNAYNFTLLWLHPHGAHYWFCTSATPSNRMCFPKMTKCVNRTKIV